MTRTKHNRGTIFHGWWIVLVAAIGLFMGYGPIVTFTFGVFLKPLAPRSWWAWGWARKATSSPIW